MPHKIAFNIFERNHIPVVGRRHWFAIVYAVPACFVEIVFPNGKFFAETVVNNNLMVVTFNIFDFPIVVYTVTIGGEEYWNVYFGTFCFGDNRINIIVTVL